MRFLPKHQTGGIQSTATNQHLIFAEFRPWEPAQVLTTSFRKFLANLLSTWSWFIYLFVVIFFSIWYSSFMNKNWFFCRIQAMFVLFDIFTYFYSAHLLRRNNVGTYFIIFVFYRFVFNSDKLSWLKYVLKYFNHLNSYCRNISSEWIKIWKMS